MFKLFPKALYFVCGLSADLFVESKTRHVRQEVQHRFQFSEYKSVLRVTLWKKLIRSLFPMRQCMRNTDAHKLGTSRTRKWHKKTRPISSKNISTFLPVHSSSYKSWKSIRYKKILFILFILLGRCFSNSKVWIMYFGVMQHHDTCLILQEFVLQHCWLWTLNMSVWIYLQIRAHSSKGHGWTRWILL